jgi:hypothetical protein
MTDDLDGLLAGFDPQVQAITRRLFALVLEVLPAAVRHRDGGDLGFGGPGYTGGYRGLVFVVTPLRSAVRLGIAGGASLPDPAGLMQGAGKVHRHIRLTSEADVDRPELEALMESAAARQESR